MTLCHRVLKDVVKVQKSMFSLQRQLSQKNNEFGNNYRNRRRDISWSEEEQGFLSLYPQIKEEILDDQLIYHSYLPELRERYTKLLDYTCHQPSIYYATAYTTIRAYKAFEKPSRVTEETLKLARIIGWCFRLNEAGMLISDDIMDNSHTRYNKPTWFNSVGLNQAMMDSNFLECSSRYLALRHISCHPQYVNIERELIKNFAACCIAQCVELDGKKYKLDEFEKNDNIVKTYPFTVPSIAVGMYLANVDDPYLHSIAKDFAIEIATFTKAEDDFDCVFVPSSSTQKHCTDVAQGRITWLGIQVAKNGTPAQKKKFEENYGKDDKDAIAQVYSVFKEMRMKDLFVQHEEAFYERMSKMIEEMPKEIPKQLLYDMLDYVVMKKYRS